MHDRGVRLGAVALAIVAASIYGCSDRHTISGSLSVPAVANCQPGLGYEDVSQGNQVVVMDEKGTTIATGTVGSPTPSGVGRCSYPFTVTDVPRASFYHVKIGRRDGPTDSYDELSGANWTWSLTLGGS